MGFAQNYFFRHTFLLPRITEPLSGLLRYIVVIPSYLEQDLISTLISLKQADKPKGYVEILIIINFSESDSDDDKKRSIEQHLYFREWCKDNSESTIKFICILAGNLPKKHAGAGLARKIGMDLALKRFDQINRPEGLILSLDADTQVKNNYFTAIVEEIDSGNQFGGCIIKFEHILEGDKYSEKVYKAVIRYELHVRYYRNILHYIGFPFAWYTIGSCFGIRARVYARHGGMNRKKAGEDFYFLHKLFPHEHFVNVNQTCVYPSPRPSLRVPFGTGPVIYKLINSADLNLLTYHPQAFYDLGKLFSAIDTLYSGDKEKIGKIVSGLSNTLKEFLFMNSFDQKLVEIQKNTAAPESFFKRFFLWFDGFRVVKYLNFVHRSHYKKIPVQQAASDFLMRMNKSAFVGNERELLESFRKLDSQ